jgi:hypothetical protein
MDAKVVCKSLAIDTCYRFLAKKEIEAGWSKYANAAFSKDCRSVMPEWEMGRAPLHDANTGPMFDW